MIASPRISRAAAAALASVALAACGDRAGTTPQGAIESALPVAAAAPALPPAAPAPPEVKPAPEPRPAPTPQEVAEFNKPAPK